MRVIQVGEWVSACYVSMLPIGTASNFQLNRQQMQTQLHVQLSESMCLRARHRISRCTYSDIAP